MESGNSEILEVLFEPQAELFPRSGFPGADPRLILPLQDHAYGCIISEKACETWTPIGGQVPNDSDTEDLLQMFINPNDVCSLRSPQASLESDSGISSDPRADTPLQNEAAPPDVSSTTIYEVVCDTGVMEGEAVPINIFSSHQENWSPPVMLPEACITSEISSILFENTMTPSSTEISQDQGSFLQYQHPGVFLTEEERRLLGQEGVSVQGGLPLTKAEERVLKKVRRKIRNKQSAQDSRRRKKEYVNGLESRVAAYSAQKQELQKKLWELETQNVSLVSQLQKLQGLIKQTSTKAAQTSTCLVILIFSLGLLILPSCSSLLKKTQISQEEYQPSGVISRTILTEGGLSDPEEPPGPRGPEPPLVETEQPQPDLLGPRASSGEKGAKASPNSVREILLNVSAPGPPGDFENETKAGPPAKAEETPKPERDPAKQMHADEM